jgi:hypothetical protein
MSKFGRKIAAAGTSALAVVALSACAQETPDSVYEDQATDTRETESTLGDQTYAQDTETTTMDTETSTMDSRTPTMGDQSMGDRSSMAANTGDEARRMATTLGISELNDIENWKITNGGEELGEIDRIGVDRSTGELLAVVGLEGVVGVNMKEVGIPLKNLTKAEDETLSTDLTMDELQQKRDIDPWDDSEVSTEDATQ